MTGKRMARGALGVALLGAVAPVQAAPMPLEKAAALFGARPGIEDISLSPDGSHVAFIAPVRGPGNAVLSRRRAAMPRWW